MFLNLFHNRRNPTRIVKTFRRPFSRRADIQQISCVSMKPVKSIPCNLNVKFMCQCRDMQQAIGTSRNSRMNQDCVFKAFLRDNFTGLHSRCLCQFYRLRSGLPCVLPQVRTCGRHKRTAWKRQTKCLRHNLHGGRRSDKRTSAAAGTCVALCPV